MSNFFFGTSDQNLLRILRPSVSLFFSQSSATAFPPSPPLPSPLSLRHSPTSTHPIIPPPPPPPLHPIIPRPLPRPLGKRDLLMCHVFAFFLKRLCHILIASRFNSRVILLVALVFTFPFDILLYILLENIFFIYYFYCLFSTPSLVASFFFFVSRRVCFLSSEEMQFPRQQPLLSRECLIVLYN